MSAKQMGALPEKDQGRQVKLKMHQPSPVRGQLVGNSLGAGASQVCPRDAVRRDRLDKALRQQQFGLNLRRHDDMRQFHLIKANSSHSW